MRILYTDIDLVLSLMTEIKPQQSKWGLICRFNSKAVDVYNFILKETQAVPVITSDWKLYYSLKELQEIFKEWAHIDVAPIDVTVNYWGECYKTFQEIEECRAMEILEHVNRIKPESWVVIDDLNLSEWIKEDHFVHLPHPNEGIKQSGRKQEIIRKLLK